MELLDLCYDVLSQILEEIDPADLAACARTSWALHNFIKANQRLYKIHYLRNLDDPRPDPTDPNSNLDWVAELQQIVKCQKILASDKVEMKRDNFRFVATTIQSLVDSASEREGDSRNKDYLVDLLQRSENLDAVIYRSSLYEHAGTETQVPAADENDRQLSAKLHCFYGMALGPVGRRSLSTHPYSRSKVYDLRNYTEKNSWGPFMNDGLETVNWEMLEAIMIILAYNIGIGCPRFMPHFKPVWSEPFGGVIKSNMPTFPREIDIPLELKDPYSISGVWHRIVCFLDWNDLYRFNFGSEDPPLGQPREPIRADEATRHIKKKLWVTKVKPPGKFDNPALPVVHFEGVARSVDMAWDPDANSRIRGSVRLTPEGEVRWTTISVFAGGEARWRSEGIQVGGVNSKRGVIGTWFDKDYDMHGPVGPTAFWKMSDLPSDYDLYGDESE